MRIYSEINYKGQILRGFHDKANDDVVAIITHGIGGNKLGHKFIFKQFADYANQNNISVMRYDFAGTGESDGYFAETKHSDQVAQVELIIEDALKQGYKKIILCSTTIGCYSVWHAKNTNNVVAYINWNPIFNYDRYEQNSLKYANPDGSMDMKGLYTNPSYTEDLATLNRVVPAIELPVLILQGDCDNEYKYGEAEAVSRQYNWDYQIIPDGNHLWEENKVRIDLFSKTIDFIKANI